MAKYEIGQFVALKHDAMGNRKAVGAVIGAHLNNHQYSVYTFEGQTFIVDELEISAEPYERLSEYGKWVTKNRNKFKVNDDIVVIADKSKERYSSGKPYIGQKGKITSFHGNVCIVRLPYKYQTFYLDEIEHDADAQREREALEHGKERIALWLNTA